MQSTKKTTTKSVLKAYKGLIQTLFATTFGGTLVHQYNHVPLESAEDHICNAFNAAANYELPVILQYQEQQYVPDPELPPYLYSRVCILPDQITRVLRNCTINEPMLLPVNGWADMQANKIVTVDNDAIFRIRTVFSTAHRDEQPLIFIASDHPADYLTGDQHRYAELGIAACTYPVKPMHNLFPR